jgi:hypothetical protein
MEKATEQFRHSGASSLACQRGTAMADIILVCKIRAMDSARLPNSADDEVMMK